MDETNQKTPAMSVDDDIILPDGWDDTMDIFDESTWASGESKTDGSGTSLDELMGSADNSSDDKDKTNANGQESSQADESSAGTDGGPATSEESDVQPKHRTVAVSIDHKDVEVDIDALSDTDFAEIYQKAHGLDRTREKLNAMTPTYEKSEMVKELLGYKSIDDMLDAAKKSYIEAEEEKLIGENVHPELAKDIVQRKVKDIEEKVIKAKKTAEAKEEETPKEKPQSASGRDFRPEVAALLQVHPELRGKTLPDEVVKDSVNTGKTLAQAYSDYTVRQAKAELDQLRKENSTLKQNAETAKRAPVLGTAYDGLTDNAVDDFLAGFEEEGDYWNRGKRK